MTQRYHEEWTDLLSGYLEGDLDAEARERLERHLSTCVRCRDVLAGLQEVVALASAAERLEPPLDLWTEISTALSQAGAPGRTEEHADGGDVIALPTATERPVRLAASPARVAVAAAALVLISVGSTWMVASTSSAPTDVVPVATDPFGDGLAPAVTGDADIPADLAAELGVLEDVLASARSSLDSATVAVLERNMETIQTAIDDSRRALATDPGNAFLAEHLERMYRRKLLYLREAVRVAEWAS